jgi:A/G-specific adenine glycosylase
MPRQNRKSEKISRLRRQLLEWYGRSARDLPWRRTGDPYAIWVSEIMLQQTRVAAVVDRYQAFMARFPTIASLAMAPEQDVLALWSGLGYYRRARMLHKAAQQVTEDHQGNLPATSAALRLLPGIGAYTAAAIASIGFGEAVAVVDGNVERVLCRLEGWEAGSPAGEAALKRKIDALAAQLVDPARPGDFNQALMELGATVCLPRNPQCLACPVATDCKTQGEHKTVPRARMQTREVAHALSLRVSGRHKRTSHEVLLEQRPAALTVMPGLWELPALQSTAVSEKKLMMTMRHAIMQVNYNVRIGMVSEDSVDAMTVAGGERRWVLLGEAAGMPLTGLARKVLTRANLLPVEALAAVHSQGIFQK